MSFRNKFLSVVFSALFLAGGAFSADFSALNVFPNPYRQDEGHTAIRFDGLPAGTEIRIYDAAGRLVLEKDNLGSATQFDWDVKNGRGERVASGVYFFVLRASDGKRETGKLAVIR